MAHGEIDFDDPTRAHALETYRIVPPDVVQTQTGAARAHQPTDGRRRSNSIESGDGGRFMTNSTMGSNSGIATIIACRSPRLVPPRRPRSPPAARPQAKGCRGRRRGRAEPVLGMGMGRRRQARLGGRGRRRPPPLRAGAGNAGGETSAPDPPIRSLLRCVTRSPSSTSAATQARYCACFGKSLWPGAPTRRRARRDGPWQAEPQYNRLTVN